MNTNLTLVPNTTILVNLALMLLGGYFLSWLVEKINLPPGIWLYTSWGCDLTLCP